jgi:hypothetical protein
MARQRKPAIGMLVEHEEPAFGRVHRGEVVQLLSNQFVYETHTGLRKMCLFNESWREIHDNGPA